MALSGSAAASDVDDLIYGLLASSGIPDDSGILCKIIKKETEALDIKCLRFELPLFFLKKEIEAPFKIYKQQQFKDNLIYKNSFGDTELSPRYDGFYDMRTATEAGVGTYKSFSIVLDPTSKYSTSMVVWAR